MSKVVVQSIGMSLDGFSAGAGQSMDEPLGVLGRDLMDWYLPTKIFIKHHGGGPATIREFLSARLIDELHLALRPMFLGKGEPLLAGLDLRELGYQVDRMVPGERAVHMFIKKSD